MYGELSSLRVYESIVCYENEGWNETGVGECQFTTEFPWDWRSAHEGQGW